MEEQMQSITWSLLLNEKQNFREVLAMLYWHVQDYLPQYLNENSPMQYIIVLFC